MPNIRLRTLSYRERAGEPLEWSVDDLRFGPVNLLVGKNATGKSRVLNLISNLAKLLRGEQQIAEGSYDVVLSGDSTSLRYVLRVDKSNVVEEKLWAGNNLMLDRDKQRLSLFYQRENKRIEHTPDPKELSSVARRDSSQHPFLIPLYDWAQAVRHYSFGSALGQDRMLIALNSVDSIASAAEINDRDSNNVLAIFIRGKMDFKSVYTDGLISDMKELGYNLSEIDAINPTHLAFQFQPGLAPVQAPGELKSIGVREDGIAGMYSQESISQGMFRALSVLIQVNYSQLSNRANCIIIDDIGEGLDFDRASLLIEMLRKKAKASNFQLIMSTNDQFVMNRIPLDEWSVLQRRGNHVSVRNIYNSRRVFEDFRFVGLSNFAFFEMDFASADKNGELKLEGEKSDEENGHVR